MQKTTNLTTIFFKIIRGWWETNKFLFRKFCIVFLQFSIYSTCEIIPVNYFHILSSKNSLDTFSILGHYSMTMWNTRCRADITKTRFPTYSDTSLCVSRSEHDYYYYYYYLYIERVSSDVARNFQRSFPLCVRVCMCVLKRGGGA